MKRTRQSCQARSGFGLSARSLPGPGAIDEGPMGGRSVGTSKVLLQYQTYLHKGRRLITGAQPVCNSEADKASVRTRIKRIILAGYERRLIPLRVAQVLINLSRSWRA